MNWLEDIYGQGGRVGAVKEPVRLPFVVLWTNMLRQAGLPEKVLPYALAQLALESNGGWSDPAISHNNFGFIRPSKNSQYQSGSFDAAGPFNKKNIFANYRTPLDFAKDYVRVLSMSPGRPIAASNAQQFYSGLRANTYFLPSEAAKYSKALNQRLAQVNNVLKRPDFVALYANSYNDPNKLVNPTVKPMTDYDDASSAQLVKAGLPKDSAIVEAKKDQERKNNWFTKMAWYEKGGVIAGGVLASVLILNATKR